MECHGLSGRMIHLNAHHRHTRISSLLPQFSAAWLQLLLVHVFPHLPGRVAVGFRGCGTSTVPSNKQSSLHVPPSLSFHFSKSSCVISSSSEASSFHFCLLAFKRLPIATADPLAWFKALSSSSISRCRCSSASFSNRSDSTWRFSSSWLPARESCERSIGFNQSCPATFSCSLDLVR